ncbi:BLOC-1-related complex subunit 5 [Agrilus planipennis]|uniref:BLOC-1-related complex subunit 5 n=1 Tax=Agrilus planipennis TaxID=224129 RepID=A0A1W4WEY8_AGRPL|nr:BLOC-1-related complex subunit 5 [Agrilus planipennis]
MGSEHSTLGVSSNIARQANLNSGASGRRNSNFKRQHTIANPGNNSEVIDNTENRPRSISPGPSLCSDVDLPYISYTVNQPIGDSPKFINRQQITKQKSLARKVQTKAPSKPVHNIVVVKPAAQAVNIERDPEIMRLQNIPMFLPIMRGTLHLPAARDPEIFERLDPTPFYKLCVKYETHLNSCANLVATEQNSLTQKIKENDIEITRLVNAATDKQKRFAKYAEKLSKVHELSHQLNRCHNLLNQLLESMETLNNSLSIEDRLEPFVWTTG